HFIATQIQPSELLQLVDAELSGLSPKFLTGDLGIFDLDSGRYVPTCSGVVARRVQEHIESEGGLGGTTILAHFGGPPYGYTANVVKACVAGLLRASKVRLQPDGGNEITAIRDAGVRDLFDKDRAFRRTTIFPAGQDDIGPQTRARICRFFEERLQHRMDREDHAIADAVLYYFPQLAQQLRSVQGQLNKLPGSPEGPPEFGKLGDALEQCIRTSRQTKPTVTLVKKHLETLQDGTQRLQVYSAELTDDAIRAVTAAYNMLEYQATQLKDLAVEDGAIETAVARVTAQLEQERPWRDIGAIDKDLAEIRTRYIAERQQLLQRQEQQVEAARGRVKARDGFSTLTAEQAHHVLRPLTQATTDTAAEAVAPPLAYLKDPFTVTLGHGEDRANDLLDEILSEGKKPLIARVDLHLRNREVATEADVQALVDEIRARLLEQVRAGTRVRLL
ncbi:hypothetical protein, partial [Actinoplanes sp. ATCC 53533]|uniref:hypothetical protein n=1 Tax=Actinoplanes sp. ATCC 53533 TaxID=1288362 RepID=UPI0018F7BA27